MSAYVSPRVRGILFAAVLGAASVVQIIHSRGMAK